MIFNNTFTIPLASKLMFFRKASILFCAFFLYIHACIVQADAPRNNTLGFILQGPNGDLQRNKTETWASQACYPPSRDGRIRCEEKTDTWHITGQCTAEVERRERLWWQNSNTPETSNFVWMNKHIDLSKAATISATLANTGDHQMLLRFAGDKGVDCWTSNSAYGHEVEKPSTLTCFQSGVLGKQDFPTKYYSTDADKINKVIKILQDKSCKPAKVTVIADTDQDSIVQACVGDNEGSIEQCKCADALFQRNFGPKAYAVFILGVKKRTAEQQAAYQRLSPSEAFNFGMGTSMMFDTANRQCRTHFQTIQSHSLFR